MNEKIRVIIEWKDFSEEVTGQWNEEKKAYVLSIDKLRDVPMVSTTEAAEMSGLTRDMIVRRVTAGKIPGARKVPLGEGKRSFIEIPLSEARKLKKEKDSGPKQKKHSL